MRSMLRRSCRFIAAGAVMTLALGAAPALVSYVLAAGPNIPYVDKDQDSDQPPTAWLLMAPPTTTSGLNVDTQAGLGQWVTYGRYYTLQDCSATIQLVRNGVTPNSGLPAQSGGGAISPGAVPGGQPGYGAMQPGYGAMQPGYPGAQAAYPPMQPGQAMGQSGYRLVQPGYPGMQPGYQGMPGYPGMQPGYAPNQAGTQAMMQQPAQLMTRQQVDAAYCFANNDRRLQGLIAPPPPVMPPGQQPLNDVPGGLGQSFPGAGQ